MNRLASWKVGTFIRRGRNLLVGLGLAGALLSAAGIGLAQSTDDIDAEPINYAKTQATDSVARLQAEIDSGKAALKYDPARGYLPSVLEQLRIPVSSQMLVFSKTSFQRDRISPLSPRAIYFNDDTYIGWVQGGSVLEVSTADPQLGAVFYTLSQEPDTKPRFVRQTYECLSCHSSTLTKGVPGHVMRSVYPGRDGLPFLQAGTFITTDQSPLKERWGGWYVTGTHGEQEHMGNVMAKNAADAEAMDLSTGANVKDLRRFFNTKPYLSPHSDIVALMVIEHQAHVQNLITRAGYETRRALHYEQGLAKAFGLKEGEHLDSTHSRIKSVGEPLVRALLFSKEAPLTGPVQGTSNFTAEFGRQGPRDKQNRSLRDFDLKQRLFRYPCSYLIHSEAFDRLPPLTKDYVYGRLRQVLGGEDKSLEFAHLSEADRKAVLEILTETKPDFAALVSR
jgi:hypothetical protein